MKQALKLIDEINRMKLSINNSSSVYLRRDYEKVIRRDLRDLEEYCSYKGIDYKELKKRIVK